MVIESYVLRGSKIKVKYLRENRTKPAPERYHYDDRTEQTVSVGLEMFWYESVHHELTQ